MRGLSRVRRFLGRLLQNLPEYVVRAMHLGPPHPGSVHPTPTSDGLQRDTSEPLHRLLAGMTALVLLALAGCGERTPGAATDGGVVASLSAEPAPQDGTVAWATTRALEEGLPPEPHRGVGIDTAGEEPNVPPTAEFVDRCNALECTFTDRSSDPDGTIVGWLWEFDDEETSTERHPTMEYDGSGDRFVRLTVLDNRGATSSMTRWIFVPKLDIGIVLTAAEALPEEGSAGLELTWQIDEPLPMEVRRNDRIIHSTDGSTRSYVDSGVTAPDSARVYRVCVLYSNLCSNAVTVTF